MKQITLTDQEANRLDMYFILNSNRIIDEIEIWEQMKGEAPAAESNLKFWKETRELIEKIRKEL